MRYQRASKEIFHGKLINLRVESISQPNGKASLVEIIEHPDAVAIVGLHYDLTGSSQATPYVVLVNQKRPAVNKMMWEIPAGLVKVNEQDNPQLTAIHELREETGYLADSWQRLIHEYPSPGFSTEAITIYLATQLHPVGSQSEVKRHGKLLASVGRFSRFTSARAVKPHHVKMEIVSSVGGGATCPLYPFFIFPDSR